MQYWIYKNGERYCLANSKEQAENIKAAIIKSENERQNARNRFVNLSVELKPLTHENILNEIFHELKSFESNECPEMSDGEWLDVFYDLLVCVRNEARISR